MRLVLFQPDIPQNTGTLLRLGACLRVPVEIIGPCGFVWSDAKLRRAGMDYRDLAVVSHHESWDTFLKAREEGRFGRPQARLVLMTTRGATPLPQFRFQADDLILMGRESAGVPDEVHNRADARVVVPMVAEARSLNVALTAAMAISEGLRQTGGFPTA